MTQYLKTFGSDTINAAPSGLTQRWTASTVFKVIDDGAGGKALWWDAAAVDSACSFDAADGDANRANSEVLIEYKVAAITAMTDPMIGGLVRANADKDGYYGGACSTTTWRVRKVVDNTKTTVATNSTPPLVVAANTRYRMRFRVNGSDLKVRVWLATDSEPSTWAIETTDTAVSAAGWVGLVGNGSATEATIYWISVGTNGDTAALPAADTTAPTLSSPSFVATSSTTGTLGVTTDEGNGTLYAVLSTSATAPSVAQVKAGQMHTGAAAAWAGTQAIASTGAKNLNATGLTASTHYYPHFVHTDAATNNSAVSTSATGDTTSAADTTAPTLTSPDFSATGSTTGSATVSTNEGNGTLYVVVTLSATAPSVAQVKAGQTHTGSAAPFAANQAVGSTGTKSFTVTGLTAATQYYAHFVHTDAAGNNSTVSSDTSGDTTTGGGDAVNPSAPSAPAFDNVTKNDYRASWGAATDNVGVTGYEYRINGGTWVNVGNVLLADISGRTPGSTDTFDVRAYDAVGNRGAIASADITLPVYGFALSTAAGLEFGNISGSLVGLGREAAGSSWTVFVHNDVTRALVLTSATVTTDASGRLPNIIDPALDSGTYFVSFRRSDGAWGGARLAAVDLS